MALVAKLVNMTATAQSTSQIELNWTFTFTDDPGTPTSSLLTLTDTSGRQYFSSPELTATSFFATGLLPGHRYVFTLVLRYDDGFTSQVTATAQTFGQASPPSPPPPPPHPPSPPPPPPHPPSPPGARPGGEFNQLGGISMDLQIGDNVTAFAVGYAVDAKQQLWRVIREKLVSGDGNLGLKPWGAADTLAGLYAFPTSPAVSILRETNSLGFTSSDIPSALGTDQSCYVIFKTFSQGGNGLIDLGGRFPFSPVMTSWEQQGRVDVFCLDSNAHLHQRSMLSFGQWTPGWNDLGHFGGSPQYLASAVSCGNNLIDIAARASTGELFLMSWNGQAWGQTDLAFSSLADPTLTSSAPGRLDILALGQDGNLYHRSRTGTALSSWEKVGATGATWAKPAAACWGANRLDVIVVGTDYSFYHKWFDGSSWQPAGLTNWEPVGGKLNRAIAPVLLAPSTNWLELFVCGTDGKWYSNSYDGARWEGWVQHNVILAA